jgi:hypothetical protein
VRRRWDSGEGRGEARRDERAELSRGARGGRREQGEAERNSCAAPEPEGSCEVAKHAGPQRSDS